MNTFLTIVLVALMVLVLVSLIRGVIAFMKSTKIDLETGQVSAQVVEDAIAVDRARRIARIEGNQCAQMIERGGQQLAHAPFPRFTSAHKVELMP